MGILQSSEGSERSERPERHCLNCYSPCVSRFPYCESHLSVYQVAASLSDFELLQYGQRLYHLADYQQNENAWYQFEQFYVEAYGAEQFIDRKQAGALYHDEMLSFLLLV